MDKDDFSVDDVEIVIDNQMDDELVSDTVYKDAIADNEVIPAFPVRNLINARHTNLINGHRRRLTRLINMTSTPITEFADNPMRRHFHQIFNTNDWNRVRADFIDLANEWGMISVDSEGQDRDRPHVKPVLVLVGVPGMYLACWTQRNRPSTVTEDLPSELVRLIASPAFIKTGAQIDDDFRKTGITRDGPILDIVEFWDYCERKYLLPARGEYSTLGWLNSCIHGGNPYVDHKTSDRTKFIKRHKPMLEGGEIRHWNEWRDIHIMFKWIDHKLEKLPPRGYCAYDLHVPFAIIASAALRRLERDPENFIGYSLTEILHEIVLESISPGGVFRGDWD